MQNADQLAEMERAMREEHRKDLEALQRLKRFLPADGDHSKIVQKPAISATPVTTNYEQIEFDVGLTHNTIIGKVESVIAADPERRWTIPQMLEQLKKDKFPLAARKPESTLGLVFSKLRRRGKIKLVRRGSGRLPNIFKGTAPKQEGDSEINQKSERATQGQPDHVH